MKTVLPFGILLAELLILGIWIGGVRILVIPPVKGLPEGQTMILANVRGLNFVDSPEAFCIRKDQPQYLCEGVMTVRLYKVSNVVARLPYNSLLHRIAGP
jgi:hypothetical protein